MDEKISVVIISNLNTGKSIKSMYILKEIFSFLKKEILLKYINYNKQLQNEYRFSIEDYKNLCRKYIKIDKNLRRIEIYILDSKIKIFEGEYINRKKNGKGKEYYDDGKLKFVGEYSNGKRKGKGKEYYKNGKLKFIGEYSNGKKKGKEYYTNGKIKFEGEYLKGKKNGKVKEYYDNGELEFEGEYLNGTKNGKGNEYYYNGKLKFIGKYLNGQKKGKGNEYYNNMTKYNEQ